MHFAVAGVQNYPSRPSGAIQSNNGLDGDVECRRFIGIKVQTSLSGTFSRFVLGLIVTSV